jgi:PBSX family phage terminase large subunit
MIQLHATQSIVARDTHQFRVINAGRRWGKSTLVAWEMFAIAVSNENARVPYYAPTRDDARDIMWKPLKDICGQMIVGEPNESRLEINVRNKFGGTSLIVLYGWEAVQERGKGVGVKNNHIFFDEVAKYKNFKFGWEEILSPTLLDLRGGATFISTPNGFNHFYDLSLMEGKNPDWKYFHFTTFDNPYMNVDEIAKKKAEITEDRFEQEYLGNFVKRSGLVYKDFSRTKHVISELPPDFECLYKLGGVDWGHTHPCAIITIKKDYEGRYFITDEFYEPGHTEEEIVDQVVQRQFNKVYPDPESASGIEALKKRKVNIRTVSKGAGSVVSGISKVQELIKQDRLFVTANCANVIMEFEAYSYPEDKGNGINERPLKENDDAMDAIRYVLMTDIDMQVGSRPQVHYSSQTGFKNRINIHRIDRNQ